MFMQTTSPEHTSLHRSVFALIFDLWNVSDHRKSNNIILQIFPSMKAVLSDEAGAKADVFLSHRGTLDIGKLKLECRHTPGHTNGQYPSEVLLFESSDIFLLSVKLLLFQAAQRTFFIMRRCSSLEMLYSSEDVEGPTSSRVSSTYPSNLLNILGPNRNLCRIFCSSVRRRSSGDLLSPR